MRTRAEHKPDEAAPAVPRFTIETDEDYALAKRRIAALDGTTRGDEEEQERDGLAEAVRAWEARPGASRG